MKIAITGANGYVGGAIAKYLSKNHTVVGLVRKPKKNDIKFILGETLYPDTLKGIDVLVHCAYDFSQKTWKDIKRVNVDGTLKLFSAAKHAGVKIIFISSISAYPGCKSMYGRAKFAAEIKGITVVRPGLVYGKKTGSIFGKLEQLAKRSSIIPMITKIDHPVYMCHDEDLAKLIEYLCTHNLKSPVIAAAQKPVQFKAVLEKLAGKRLHFIPVPYSLALVGIRTLEILHIPLSFRSDSLVSLAYPNPRLRPKELPVSFREF